VLTDLTEESEIDEKEKKANNQMEDGENELTKTDIDVDELNASISNSGFKEDLAITNATKTMLSSICTVFNLFFDDNYKNDYHVSLEKVMQLKKFEHGGERAVSISL